MSCHGTTPSCATTCIRFSVSRLSGHSKYPAEFEGRRLSNPAFYNYGAALTAQTATGTADVVPIVQVRILLEDAIQLPDVFADVGIDLVAVDIVTASRCAT
jgi:hypothetical protein